MSEERVKDGLKAEVEIVQAENMTLKRLLVAKDSLLIQKTRSLDSVKVGRTTRTTSVPLQGRPHIACCLHIQSQ